MRKYIYTSILIAGILATGIFINACTNQDFQDEKESSGSGNIRFSVTLPSVSAVNENSPFSTEISDYPSDFEVKQLNAYLFDANGNLTKSFINVSNQLSSTTTTTNITLQNVPAGNNQTLVCVANPDAFEQLVSLPESVTLQNMLKFTSKPVNTTHPDAPLFMVTRNTINVGSGTTTNISGILTRGVARLDVFTVDNNITVDSVRVSDAAARGYLLESNGQATEKVSFTQIIEDFEGNSKIAYLHEAPTPTQLEIFLTRDETQGVANIQIPSVTRNNIYSVNLEVRNGTHLVTGTLTVSPWEKNILEGNVASEVAFDREATLSSFHMEDGGSVTMENDTTLLIPGGHGTGLLCFRDGAEIGIDFDRPDDKAVMNINRNSVTRGSIKTCYDIQMTPFHNTEQNAHRDARIRVTNLLTGKGKIFIIRQKAAGYKEMNVPLLNFSNSHQHVFTLPLEGVTSIGELTMPTNDNFEVTMTKVSDNYQITVRKKRIYEIVPPNSRLIVTRSGKKTVILNLQTDRGFVYEEVTMGNVTFMDRDLGAADKNHPGEIFIPGSLLPLNQSGFSYGAANGYVNQGRVNGADISHNYKTKWFTENGLKNKEIDPCPSGWHVATYNEYSKIFTYVTTQRDNPITNQGSLKTTVTFDTNNKNVNVSLNSKTLTFDYSGGHYYNGSFAYYSDWPCGWWTSSKESNGRFQHLSFDVISPYEIGLRVHNISTGKVGLNIRCVKDNSGQNVKTIPTVTLGGKEWMAFNSMGKGNEVQLSCQPWEKVEDLYRNQWTDHLGKFFQWGRKYAHNQWGTYENNPGGETNSYTNWNDKPEQLPCPDGFRIPTKEELNALLPSVQLPRQATYLYGNERVRAELLSADPPTISGWHDYSGRARYLKITSLKTGKYLILPLGGCKPDKSTGSSPDLGKNFRLWTAITEVNNGRVPDLVYVPGDRTVAVPTLDHSRPKEGYDYVRCIKK